MRADLQSLVDRFGATGWYYSPVDPNTPRFYTTLTDWTNGGYGSGRRYSPAEVAAAIANPGGGDSGPGMGDFVPYTWDQYPESTVTMNDGIRGFVWHPNMPRYITRAFEIRDEGYYDVAPNSRTFFDRLTFGVTVAVIAAGSVAIGAGLAGVDVATSLATESPLVGPVETPLLVGPVETALVPAAVADVAPFVGPIEVVTTTTPGWTLAETIAATKAAGTTALEGAKVVNQVAGAVGAGAAVVAAIKGPQEQPTQAPGGQTGGSFSGIKNQLASVNKNVWYAVGGIAVLLAMG